MPALLFAGFLVAMVVVGLIVKKVTGSHAWFLEDWKYEPGETIVWRDDRADAYPLAKTGQALFMTVVLRHQNTVIATNQRILIAQRTPFSKKTLVRWVLYPGSSPDGHTQQVGGGLLTVGYESIAYEPGVLAHAEQSGHERIELTPLFGEASSLNLEKLYIYTDLGDTFSLPQRR